ncbi:Cpn60 TCP1 domain containing protein [Trichuris trichiura]|uniref:T-complex protein 1 subunit theta n=1 Tax=Trichuris trichiura TaxID=36087 RepID=A0A077Z6J3_TRITR|nr:Cpn60 TCP1 domain containing protein [Trichuris trichiura]
MSTGIPKVGFPRLLKEGARHFRGIEETVHRSVEACLGLAQTVRSSYGPTGMNKVIVNRLEKLFVTNDAATVLKELQIEHPAAKLLVMASEEQEREVGDGTNGVIILAVALLENARELIHMGLSAPMVISGYELAGEKALEYLSGIITLYSKAVAEVIRSSILTKQYGNADFLAQLVTSACQMVLPKNPMNFNVDHVRTVKVLGASVTASTLFNGMVFAHSIATELNKVEKAKVVVFSCPFDLVQAETKSTVSLNTAKELMQFAGGEEKNIEEFVKGLHQLGINVVVTGGKLGDLHVHFLNKYKMLGVKVGSKFDLRRLCRSVGAVAIPTLEVGECDEVYIDEIGSDELAFFKQNLTAGHIATIIIRGSSANVMDDTERAVIDGINNFPWLKSVLLFRTTAFLLAVVRLSLNWLLCPGMEQYSINKFAVSMEVLPKQLADNSGPEGTTVADMVPLGIYDPYLTKYWMIKLATNLAVTLLSVDQVARINLCSCTFNFAFRLLWPSRLKDRCLKLQER